jgi:uroporphyrinogen decarboxylase
MCNTPALCADVTLQPLRRFPGLDAVVIFSDILIVPQAMGLEVRMAPGPVFPAPLRGPDDVRRLTLRPDADAAFAPLYEGITLTRATAAAEGRPVPVIGFCGAPWTLFGYMVDGAPPPPPPGAPPAPPPSAADKEKDKAKQWLYKVREGWGPSRGLRESRVRRPSLPPSLTPLYAVFPPPPPPPPHPTRAHPVAQDPASAHAVLAAIADVCVDLLVGQWRAGASILQVFESSGGDLPPRLFADAALPYLARIARGVRERVPPVAAGGPPLIVFPRGATSGVVLDALAALPYDVIGLDWETDAAEAVARVAAAEGGGGALPRKAFQGNLDPVALHAPRRRLIREVAAMLSAFRVGAAGAPGLVGNLGHGMSPSHDPRALAFFFDAVGELSARAIRGDPPPTEEELDALADPASGLGRMVVPPGF